MRPAPFIQRPGHRRNRAGRPGGFTLIELMVVLSVIALLSALAYPSYLKQQAKARRADAKSALLDLATRQERYFSIANTYTTSATTLGFSSNFPLNIASSGSSYYQLEVTSANASGFVLTATPIGAQIGDACGNYTLNNLGQQGNSTSSTGCW